MRALGDALPCTYIARKRGMMREEDEREMHRVNPCTPISEGEQVPVEM